VRTQSQSRALRRVIAGVVVAGVSLWAGVSGPVHAAAASTYYFHGGPADDANRIGGTPTATFDATAPTGATPSTQTSAPRLLAASPCGDMKDAYWTGAFTGTISGHIHIDWWWQTTNAEAIAVGTQQDITVCGDGLQIGSLLKAPVAIGPTPTESTVDVPVAGTVATTLVIEAVPTFTDTGEQNTVLYNSTAEPSFFIVNGGPAPTPSATPVPTAAPTPGAGNTGNQLFANYAAPTPYPHVFQPPTGVALLFGEPSIGVDWGTTAAGNNLTMYQGDLNTWQIKFQYAAGVVPTATWSDRSDTAIAQTSLDARLINDHAGRPADRTFVEQLAGAVSFQAYSDTDGGTAAPPANSADWIASTTTPNGGVDHESIGAGRYSVYTAPPAGAGVAYPHALYYCSQSGVNAFCIRSDDGGVTYGAPAQAIPTSCNSLHGKPRVGPDGVVYLPDNDCGVAGANKAVSISTDNGQTWTVHNIPNTTTDPNQLDPDVAIGGASGKGTVYYTYRDGDHHAKVVTSTDDGTNWSTAVDLGTAFNIQNAQFTEVVAGDQNRAAVTFIGTTCPGDDSVEALSCNGLPAIWHLYVAFTYDGGLTWQVVDATPNDPVQRGGVCAGGTGCPSNGDGSTSRNMLDFNDITVDKQGRVQAAWTDGCTGSCVNTPSGGTACAVPDVHADGSVCLGRNSSLFSASDQTCGMGLFATFDPGFNNDPACVLSSNVPEVPIVTGVAGAGIAAVAIAVLFRRRRRSAEVI
jgi:hypothetical protein